MGHLREIGARVEGHYLTYQDRLSHVSGPRCRLPNYASPCDWILVIREQQSMWWRSGVSGLRPGRTRAFITASEWAEATSGNSVRHSMRLGALRQSHVCWKPQLLAMAQSRRQELLNLVVSAADEKEHGWSLWIRQERWGDAVSLRRGCRRWLGPGQGWPRTTR